MTLAPAREPGARGDGALERAIAARTLDRTRVLRTIEIGESFEVGEGSPM